MSQAIWDTTWTHNRTLGILTSNEFPALTVFRDT
jgi:hypothetical protein